MTDAQLPDDLSPAVALDFALLALALAGQGDAAGAVCRWQAAQSLDPQLRGVDLAPYGEAGRLLADYRLDPPHAKSPGSETAAPPKPLTPDNKRITKPRLMRYHAPVYTQTARREKVEGSVIAESIIDTEGRVTHPGILRGCRRPLGGHDRHHLRLAVRAGADHGEPGQVYTSSP